MKLKKQRSKEHETFCKEDHHRRRTGAALLAGTAPKAAAQCPYTPGPLGRYIAPAIVQGMTATDDGAVEVWCTDALDGDDWYFLVDVETDLRIYDRVDLVVDANGTPEDFSDDRVIDALYCHGCTEED